MIVARQGMGNMAVGNAFGSNVFNVFMGLGLPWFLYCFFGDSDVHHDSHTYHGLDKDGVVFPTLVLLALLVMFIILLMCTNMKLYKYVGINIGPERTVKRFATHGRYVLFEEYLSLDRFMDDLT